MIQMQANRSFYNWIQKLEVEVHIMIFQMASTSAYDKNEVQVYLKVESL